jgi:hypothetical protein
MDRAESDSGQYDPQDDLSLATDAVDAVLLIGDQLREFDDLPDNTLAVLLVGPRGIDAIFHTHRIPLSAEQVVGVQRLFDRLTANESAEAALRGLAYRIHGVADRVQEIQDYETGDGA